MAKRAAPVSAAEYQHLVGENDALTGRASRPSTIRSIGKICASDARETEQLSVACARATAIRRTLMIVVGLTTRLNLPPKQRHSAKAATFQRVSTKLTPFGVARRSAQVRMRSSITLPPPTPAAAPTCAAVEGAIPAPTSPTAAPTGSVSGRADRGRSSDWMKSAITEIGADPEGATDRSAMDAGDRQRREWPPDSGVGF